MSTDKQDTLEIDTKEPHTHDAGDVLDRNIEGLMRRAHEPPVMSRGARARILSQLSDSLPEPERGKLWSLLFGTPRRGAIVAACAVAAVAVVGVVAIDRDGDVPVDARIGKTLANNEAVPVRHELPDGSTVLLRRGTELSVSAERRVVLTAGAAVFDVAKSDRPFVVETAAGESIALGTRFVVDASSATVMTAVARGRVEVKNVHGKMLLRAGQAANLSNSTAPVRRPIERLSKLMGWAKAEQRRAEGKPRARPIRSGALLARHPNWQQRDYPLPMTALNIDVHVENQIARVAIDQTFANAHPFQLEGVYSFPLPVDASISRLAMYVGEDLVESGIVERQRGRRIYEDIVYQRRDPALLEWMAGNQFKVRIFPLPAREEKRILLSYTQSLTRLYDDVDLRVPIPEIDSPVKKVNFRVRLVDCARCEIRSTSHDVVTSADGDDAIVTFEAANHTIGDDLLLTVRSEPAAVRVVRHADTGKADDPTDDESYVLARIRPQLPERKDEVERRRWVILADTSASRKGLERKAQDYLVTRLLTEFDEEDEVAVLAFDTTVREMAPGFAPVSELDRRAVHTFLEGEGDGAGSTDLSRALAAAVSKLSAAGSKGGLSPYILYLGDGIATGGSRDATELARQVAGKATVVGVAVGEKQDRRMLRAITAATGGLVTEINPGDDIDWKAFDLIATLNTARAAMLSAELFGPDGTSLETRAYLSAPAIAHGEELAVMARRTGADAATKVSALVLRGMVGGKAWQQRFELASGDDADAPYLPRLWAEKHIDALLAIGEKDTDKAAARRAEIVSLARKNWLLTPHTSLLVLENDKMYKEYDVVRSTGTGWAAYKAPTKIKVVKVDPADLLTSVPLDAVVRRTIRPLLSQVQGLADGKLADTSGLFAVLGEGREVGLELDANESSGRMRTTGRNRGPALHSANKAKAAIGSAVRAPAEENSEGFLSRRAAEPRERDADAEAPAAGADLFVLDTTSVGDSLDWGAGVGRGGGGKWANQQTIGMGNTRGGLGYRGRYGYYGWHVTLPTPAAMYSPTDIKFVDLSEWMPAIASSKYDLARERLRRMMHKSTAKSDRGPSFEAARAVIERARAHVTGRRYRVGKGPWLAIDRSGRLFSRRDVTSGLVEEMTYDGETLWHVYPDFGVAFRREVGDTEGALFNQLAPQLLPRASTLARWYDLSVDGGKLVLTSRRNGTRQFHFEFDRTGRLIATRRYRGDATELVLEVEYDGANIVVSRGGRSVRAVREAFDGNIEAISTADRAVVEMPLRRAQYWLTKGVPKDDPNWRHVQLQLVASYLALGDLIKARDVVKAMAEHGPLTVGELAIASRAVAGLPVADRKGVIGGAVAEHPVARYLEAGWAYAKRATPSVFDAAAGKVPTGFVPLLAKMRGAIAEINRGQSPDRSANRMLELAKTSIDRRLVYIGAHRMHQYYLHRDIDQVEMVWNAVAKTGPWAIAAEQWRARALHSRGKNERAVRVLRDVAAIAATEGYPIAIDYYVTSMFRQSSYGEAGWQYFWAKYRDRVLLSSDPKLVATLLQGASLQQGTALGIAANYDMIARRLLELDAPTEITLQVVAVLTSHSRFALAAEFLDPLLARADKGGPDAPIILETASQLAEHQGDRFRAANLLRRAVEQAQALGYPMPLSKLRNHYARLFQLYAGVARADRKRSDSARESAMAIVREWRSVDPDNVNIDRQAAELLFTMGDSEGAWRQLSTAIERHPMEGSAYDTVAKAMQGQGKIEIAAAMWKQAATVEPTNPTWLLSRSKALATLGDDAGADALLLAIKDGKWHERFIGVVGQAERLRRLRKQ